MHGIARSRLYLSMCIVFLAEAVFSDWIDIGFTRPNIMLILIIFAGLHLEWKESLEAGLVAGLLRGAASIGHIGASMFIFGLCALFASYCKNKIYKENFLTQIMITFFMAFCFNILALLSKIVIQEATLVNLNIWRASILSVASFSVYTAAVAPPAFLILIRLFNIREPKY